MKRVIVIVTYEAYIPEDMTISSISENIEEVINDRFDGFRVSSDDYHDDDESEPLFSLDDVKVCNNCIISAGVDE